MKTIDVIIPTYKPGKEFENLICMLLKQTYRINHIFVMATVEDKSMVPASDENITYTPLLKSEFDHGKTRDAGIRMSNADYVLLMTQDAIPADGQLVSNLLKSFDDSDVAVAYARQLPKADCRCIERYSRDFNYPDISRKKTADDISKLGIKAFFCSDVCAMYDRERYIENGGFITKTIFNEDMIMANTLLKAGYAVYYCADAKVYHSHNYGNSEQFHRNFDLGVSQIDNPEVFGNISSESEGMKYIKKMTGLLATNGKWYYIPYFYVNSACRLLGYKLGKNYKKLPKGFVRFCSMDKSYWDK